MDQDEIDRANIIEIMNNAVKDAGMEATMDYKVKAVLILLCEELLRLGYNGGIKKAIEICKKRGAYDVPQHLEQAKVDRLKDRMTKDQMANFMGEKKWHL